jgi:tellurite resistance protein TehA-like permease
MIEKSKKSWYRDLMIAWITLFLSYFIINIYSSNSSPLSFLWVIKNALWLSGAIVLFAAMIYVVKPSKQEQEARKTSVIP